MPCITYGFVDAKEEERHLFQEEALHRRFLGAPDWLTCASGAPILPPPDLPIPSPPSTPLFYKECYYHRIMQLLSTVMDLQTFEGPLLLVECRIGGQVVIFRHHLPNLKRCIASDPVPFLIDIAKSRYGHLAEFTTTTVCKLQDYVDEGTIPVIYCDRSLEDYKHLLGRALYQMVRALQPKGLLIAPISPHKVYNPSEKLLQQVTQSGLEVVAELPMADDITAAFEKAEAHMAACLGEDASAKKYWNGELQLNEGVRRLIRQKYTHSIIIFRKTCEGAPPIPNPEASNGTVANLSINGEENGQYGEEVVTWYEQYELDGRSIPDWVRQLSYPCLPPPGLPSSPPVGENAHFYLDAFYHRIMALAATVIDLQTFEGPCIFTGCGLGGMVPILRSHMPSLKRLVAGDIVPFFLNIAKSRGLDAHAELCVLDVLKLDDQFEPNSFQMLIDDAIVSHMRNDGGPYSHLFKPAIQQVHKVLAPGGYFLPNGTLKLQTMQTSDGVIADIEAEGFKLLATEDLTSDCLKACDLMEEHILGSSSHPGCLTEQDRQLYPELVTDVRDSFTEYYRTSMSRGTKGLAHWIFQKV